MPNTQVFIVRVAQGPAGAGEFRAWVRAVEQEEFVLFTAADALARFFADASRAKPIEAPSMKGNP